MTNKRIVFLICASIFLLSTILSLCMITSVSGIEEITEPRYIEIADYYDNRTAVVTVTADDWYASTTQSFEDMSTMLTGKHIYYTGAVITGENPDWPQIQRWLDQGYLEVASHSRDFHPQLPYDTYDSEIGGSKQDIIGNLTLPPMFSFSGTEYVYSWIEPWGDSDSMVRQKLGEYKYLTDRRVDIDDEWATWDSANGLFNRIGFSMRMESEYETNVTKLNDKFDIVHNAGGIYHLFTHPVNVNWETGQYADLHTSYISNRNDVWYVNFGLLYLYHWIDTQNVTQVTSTGSLQDKVFKINISSTDRQNYGAKYPVTYVFNIPASWSNAYAKFRIQETDSWTTMENKTSSDFFNGINAVRFDFSNHKAYVSIGFDNASNEIFLQILPQDSQPKADFSATPTSGPEPLTVSFTDLSTSYDGITSWTWNFGDGEVSLQQNPTHVYTTNGTYTVSLTVLEEDGNSYVETKVNYITVIDTAPLADFSYFPIPVAFSVAFNASGSTGYDQPLSYTWDFGDGNVTTAIEPLITHRFPSSDAFDVSLTVTDADGSTDTITKQVSVLNVAPTADFSIVSSPNPTVDEDITFTDQSSDLDGTIVSWYWNLGDGTNHTSQNVTHRYYDIGTFTVNLTVTDNDGENGTISKNITIYDVVAPFTDDDYNGLWHTSDFIINLTATDDVSGVHNITTYYRINDGSNMSVQVDGQPLISEEGYNKLEYWSVDTAGNEEIHKIIPDVKLDKTNPTANAGADQAVDEDKPMTFDGSASFDNINITSYTWTFFDETLQTLTEVNPTYTFNTPRNYNVTLTVTDAALNSATDTVVITVIDVTKPIANAGDDRVVHEKTTVMFNGSDSYDPEGGLITSYIWTFIDDKLQTLSGVNSTYIFEIPGIYNVTLTISDEQGNSATDIVTITVVDATWPAANAGLDQIVDEDTLVNFDGSASLDNVGIISYIWTFTDGTLQTIFGINSNYTFETPGVYTVTLNVSDAEGHHTTDSVMITVLDITPPIVDIGSYTSVVERVPVNFDASGSSDNVGIVSYLWDFGDGTVENSTISSVIRTYTNPGVYMVILTVMDGEGNDAQATISIVVNRDTDGDLIADLIDTDDDNDGMSDDWEILRGLDPFDPSDASLDIDGDGLSNLTEYQIGSDPNVYTSPSPFPLFVLLVVAIIGFIISLGILFWRKL